MVETEFDSVRTIFNLPQAAGHVGVYTPAKGDTMVQNKNQLLITFYSYSLFSLTRFPFSYLSVASPGPSNFGVNLAAVPLRGQS